MALTLSQQILELIDRSPHILVAFRKGGGADHAASALALAHFLRKRKKIVDVLSDGWQTPPQIRFLPEIGAIKPELTHAQKFTIAVDVGEVKLSELSYDVKGGTLEIYLTPRTGQLSREHIRTAKSELRYSLVIVLGAPDLESLGRVYEENTELFYRTPIINIDSSPANEHFGQINVIELTATSVAEVVHTTIESMNSHGIDETIAQCLLTGMIAATRSFRTPNVTPKTLSTAAGLMHAGADREVIVKNLFRTRTVASLKLWGLVLANLQHDAGAHLVWAKIAREDFVRTGAREEDLPEVVDELIATSPEAEIAALVYEPPTSDPNRGTCVIVATQKSHDAKALTKPFSPEGDRERVSLCIRKPITEATAEVVEQIRKMVQ